MTLFVKNPERPGFSATFQSADTWNYVEHDTDGNILVHFDSPAKAEIARDLVQAVIGNRNGIPQVAVQFDEGPTSFEKYRKPLILVFPAQYASFC